MMMICTLSITVYYPFLDNVSEFYEERFGWSEARAGRVVMIGYLIAGNTYYYESSLLTHFRHCV
jgi:hypothetical protein